MSFSLSSGKLEFGEHAPFSKTLHTTIRYAIDNGMYSFQCFLGNPQSMKRATLSNEDINFSKSVLERYPMNVFFHAPYICNCCGSTHILAWSGNAEQDSKTLAVVNAFDHELKTLDKIWVDNGRIRGLVIHPGSHVNAKAGLEAIAQTICKIPALSMPGNSLLLLENSAGQGTSLARSFQEISTILHHIAQLSETVFNRVSVCIDTAHIHGMGEYDLSTIRGVDKMFDDFERIIGMKRFSLLHLNDSEVKLGSKVDRHAPLGQGTIWGKDKTALFHLLRRCVEHDIPVVLETGYTGDLTLLREWSRA